MLASGAAPDAGTDAPVAGIATPGLTGGSAQRPVVARLVRFAENSFSVITTGARGMTIEARVSVFEVPAKTFRVQDDTDRPSNATFRLRDVTVRPWDVTFQRRDAVFRARDATSRREDETVGTRHEASWSPGVASVTGDVVAEAREVIP